MVPMIDFTNEQRPFSINWRRYDRAERAADQRYARLFTHGWDYCTVKIDTVASVMGTSVWSPIIWRTTSRAREQFLASHWCALDFETNQYTLEMAINEWSDSICVIGITDNHQIPKHVPGLGVVPLDRFRILTPWAKPIESRDLYESNMRALIEKYGADKSCSDAARLFFPCREIVFANTEGYLQPVKPKNGTIHTDASTLSDLRQSLKRSQNGVPRWLNRFLAHGKMPMTSEKLGSSRAWMVWACATNLWSRGWTEEQISTAIHASPFDRTDFGDEEINQKIAAGIKKAKAERTA